MGDGSSRARILVSALLLVVGCGGCGGGGARQSRSGSTSPPAHRAVGRVPAPAVSRRIPLIGFNDNSIAGGLLSPSADAQLSAKLGVNSVRVTLDWSGSEFKRGQFNFGFADSVYQAMSALGIAVLWIPMFAPPWAAAGCPPQPAVCHAPQAPAYDADWSDFIARVTARYPRSAGIEVWNEPNYAFFWMPRPDPVRYTQVLAEAYRAVKRINPAMPVIMGGVGNKPIASGSTDTPLDQFTRAVFANGGASFMDGIGIHPYPLGVDEGPFEQSIADVRSIRAAYGASAKPLWLTETGWTTTGPQAISPADQALELTDLMRRAESMPDVHALYVHTLLEHGAPQDFETGFGVLRVDGTPKPAALALQKALAQQRAIKP